jgi:hypothetical protein
METDRAARVIHRPIVVVVEGTLAAGCQWERANVSASGWD